jgi:serine/threonine-protein kinase
VKPGDDADTVVMADRDAGDRTSRTSLPPEGAASRAASTLSETAIVVLRSEAAQRAVTFGRAAATVSSIGLLLQLGDYPEGSRPLRIAMCVTLAVFGATGLWVANRATDPARYLPSTFRVFAATGLIASCVGQLYMGVFSPVAAVTALGLSFFGLGDDRRTALGLCGAAVAFHFGLAILVTMDVVPDAGVFSARVVSREARTATLVMIGGVYAMTVYQARISRRAMIEAVERANTEARIAREREAQLQEARLDLDLAQRAGAPGGRYTGARIAELDLAEIVGRGAMGEIYAARHRTTGEPRAVKLLHAVALRDPDAVKRFVRECQIAVRVSGPNLVRVTEVGQTDSGAPYIAMELLEGSDLQRILRRRARLSLDEAVTLVRDVAAGLSVAHAAGVVHRDLKPQNLFLAEQPGGAIWKILDFGVSKLQDGTGTLTDGAIVGTPAYMSPEQARSRPSDLRTDLFALGVVVYRVLTGRPAFAGEDMPQILFEVVGGTPTRPTEVAVDLPRDVDAFVAIATAKRADDRFQTAQDFADAFAAAARGALDPALRRRARSLVHERPWGRRASDPGGRREA